MHLPKESTDADLLTVVQMFSDYTNSSNVTIINVTATHATVADWLEQRQAYFGTVAPQSPPPPPEDKNPDVERPFFFNEDGTRADIPQLARANGLTEHFTETTAYRLRYILAEGLAERYFLAGKLRGDPEEMPKAYFARAACGDEDAMLVKVHVRVLLQPHEGFDSRADFFARMYGVTLDAALKRFDVRTCHTETTENIRLECDPAPSPPPPDNWVVPPSPPVLAFELVTLSAATGTSGLFLIFGAVCCLGMAGRSYRSRHNSRMLGTRTLRVDEMPYARQEANRRGELWDGPVRNDLAFRGRMLANTAARPTTAPAPSAFTFASLIGNDERRQFYQVSTE